MFLTNRKHKILKKPPREAIMTKNFDAKGKNIYLISEPTTR